MICDKWEQKVNKRELTMQKAKRIMSTLSTEQRAILSDAIGVIALFALTFVALQLPFSV